MRNQSVCVRKPKMPTYESFIKLFKSQVEHRTGIAEVSGSNLVEALIFFRLLPSNCLNWRFTVMITLHFHQQPQYTMNFIYISLHEKV